MNVAKILQTTNCTCQKCEFFYFFFFFFFFYSFFDDQLKLETQNRFDPLTKEKKIGSSSFSTSKNNFIGGLKFVSININSIRGKKLELLAFLDFHQPHVVAIQEEKIASSIATSELFPESGPYINLLYIKIISDSRIRYTVSKGPKYRFPSRIDFKKCREEIASALNDFGNRWCKREYVEPDALKEWKVSIFKIVDQRIKFYSQNTYLLPPKPKSTFRHLKQGIQDFRRKYVLVPADKAANNVVVV